MYIDMIIYYEEQLSRVILWIDRWKGWIRISRMMHLRRQRMMEWTGHFQPAVAACLFAATMELLSPARLRVGLRQVFKKRVFDPCQGFRHAEILLVESHVNGNIYRFPVTQGDDIKNVFENFLAPLIGPLREQNLPYAIYANDAEGRQVCVASIYPSSFKRNSK